MALYDSAPSGVGLLAGSSFGWPPDGGGGGGITSSKKPGKNRSIRSCVAAQSARCLSERLSLPEGRGTSMSIAFMTRTTFFRLSGIASYCYVC